MALLLKRAAVPTLNYTPAIMLTHSRIPKSLRIQKTLPHRREAGFLRGWAFLRQELLQQAVRPSSLYQAFLPGLREKGFPRYPNRMVRAFPIHPDRVYWGYLCQRGFPQFPIARRIPAFHWVLAKWAVRLARRFLRGIGKNGFFVGFLFSLLEDFRLNGVFDNFFREDGNRKIGQQERGCQQPREQLFSMGFAHITTSFEMENPLIREESG